MRNFYSRFLLFFILACGFIQSSAQTVTIGTGNEISRAPWDPYYGYTYSQTIYLQSQISGSGNITSIRYYYNGTTLANSNTVVVYMGHTTKTIFSSTSDWVPVAGLTQVFSGTVPIPATLPGWVTITLTTPFAYNNTDNLLIAADENKDGFEDDPGFRFRATLTPGNNRTIYNEDDVINPDPAAPPTGILNARQANIQIDGLTLVGCQAPTGVNITAITTTTATASWTAPAGGLTVSQYNWELRTSGAAGSGATGLVSSGNTATTSVNLTALTPGTVYTFYVRSDCGGTQSSWNPGTNFTTACTITSPPYFENFDGVTAPALPPCITRQDLNGGTTWNTSPTNPRSAPNSMTYTYSTSLPGDDWFFTQGLNLTGGTSYRLSFYYRARSSSFAEALEVKYGNSNTAAAMTSAAIFSNTNITNDTYSVANIDFIPPSTGVYYIGFHAISAPDKFDLHVDDVSVIVSPSCAEPTGVAVSSITTTSASVSFTSPGNSFIVEYGPSGFTPGTGAAAGTGGTIVTGTASPITLTGLMPGTAYSVYVRQNCSGTYSANSAVVSFTTVCAAVTTFTENFDAVTPPALPPCWFKVGAGGLASTQTSNPNSTPNTLYIFSGSPTDLAVVSMPPVSNLNAATHRLTFKARANFTVGGVIEVGYLTDPSNAASFTLIQSFSISALTYQDYSVIPGALPAGVQVLAFRHTGNPANSVLIDDVSWAPIPGCLEPTALTVTAATTTASFSWTAPTPAPANGYQWEIRSSGAAGSGATGLAASGTTAAGVTSANATGLTAATAYTLYVRSDCGGGNFSSWTPKTFSTFLDCAAGTVITECTDVSAAIAAGAGVADFSGPYPNNSVGFSTPGKELIYRFTPSSTGVYYLEITNAPATGPGSGYIDYFYKPASAGCTSTGWIGIDDNSLPGKDAIGMLQAGVEYYILLDAESTTTAPTQTFRICKAVVTSPATTNACVPLVSPGGSIPANSSKIEYLIDGAGNLVASLDFSGVSNSAGSISASYYVNSGPLRHDGSGKEYLDRNVTITTGIVPANPVVVRFYFLNSELTTLINDPDDGISDVTSINDLKVTKTSETCAQSAAVSSGGVLINQTGNGTFDANASFITINVSSFSTFYIHGGLTPLPASLLTFSGQRTGSMNQLKWTTATEQNNRGFYVERSADGRTYSSIGFVATQATGGNSNSVITYSFADNNISGDRQYYRLRQVDLDGKEKLSNIVLIRGVKTSVFIVIGLFPNPATSKVNVMIDAPSKDNITLFVTDISGKVVRQQKAMVESGSNTIEMEIDNLASGTYMMKMVSQTNGETSVIKFVKQ